MNELEKETVNSFIDKNPVILAVGGGSDGRGLSPKLYRLGVSLEDLREDIISRRVLNGGEFASCAIEIAIKYGCCFNLINCELFTNARGKEAFGRIKNAQKEIYELHAPLIAAAIYGELWELDDDGLLLPALVDMGLISKL